MSSGYRHKTPHLGIPVPGKKDRIKSVVEWRKYSIIENMLIAGTQGLNEVVFDDGPYVLKQDGEQYVVSLTAGGNYPSIHGIVGGFYFKGSSTLKWEGLKKGYLYYLYIMATPKTSYENSAIRLSSSTYRLGKGCLLVASVDLRGDVCEVEPYPDGKVYSQDVARHASDTTNPHGVKMEQDELVVNKSLVLGMDATVELSGKTVTADELVMSAAALVGRNVCIVNFNSGGSEGVLLQVDGNVVNVQTHRRGGDFTETVGEVGIGYHGDDNSVDSEKEFKVYNTGAEGVPMRALVICR